LKLLLDTHALLWQWADSSRLSADAAAAILTPPHETHVSAASVWEIAIKMSNGRLRIVTDFDKFVEKAILENGYKILPIEAAHAAESINLPWIHRDPFDRMLAAQARVEKMALVSSDAIMDQYGVTRIW